MKNTNTHRCAHTVILCVQSPFASFHIHWSCCASSWFDSKDADTGKFTGWTYGRVCHYLFIDLLQLYIEHVHRSDAEQDSGEMTRRETNSLSSWSVHSLRETDARLFVTLWTVTHQIPLPMGAFRQEYWSVLPFPFPGDLPDPWSQPVSPASSTVQADCLPLSHLVSPLYE